MYLDKTGLPLGREEPSNLMATKIPIWKRVVAGNATLLHYVDSVSHFHIEQDMKQGFGPSGKAHNRTRTQILVKCCLANFVLAGNCKPEERPPLELTVNACRQDRFPIYGIWTPERVIRTFSMAETSLEWSFWKQGSELQESELGLRCQIWCKPSASRSVETSGYG
ncbi:hypothetical protein B0H11DRAFT_1988654 [Mycena galericulata]|nr:hypothetical protein B0H11DRAFT_1988654 [Mycena galericulata]